MEPGVVKWFNEAKGYGFITPDNGGADVWVHFSAIVAVANGSKILTDGQRVQFCTEDGPRGPSVAKVSGT